jgi:hypothetical protein
MAIMGFSLGSVTFCLSLFRSLSSLVCGFWEKVREMVYRDCYMALRNDVLYDPTACFFGTIRFIYADTAYSMPWRLLFLERLVILTFFRLDACYTPRRPDIRHCDLFIHSTIYYTSLWPITHLDGFCILKRLSILTFFRLYAWYTPRRLDIRRFDLLSHYKIYYTPLRLMICLDGFPNDVWSLFSLCLL